MIPKYVELLNLAIHIHNLLHELQESLNDVKRWLPLFA